MFIVFNLSYRFAFNSPDQTTDHLFILFYYFWSVGNALVLYELDEVKRGSMLHHRAGMADIETITQIKNFQV